MNGRTALGCAAALALAASISCGSEEAKKGAAPEGGGPAAATAPADAPVPTPAKAEAVRGEALSGTATAKGDAGPGIDAPLSLVLGDGGRLGGEVEIGGAKCAISGMVEEGVARGWLTCPAGASGEPARRGTLVGEKAGGGYAGTFAISDNGATSVVGGSWKAGE